MKLRKYKIEKEWSKQFNTELEDAVDLLFALAANREITLYALAKKSRCNYQTIVDLYERNTQRPAYSTVWKIAKGLGVQVALRSPALNYLKRKAS